MRTSVCNLPACCVTATAEFDAYNFNLGVEDFQNFDTIKYHVTFQQTINAKLAVAQPRKKC